MSKRKAILTTRITALGRSRKVRIQIPPSPFRPVHVTGQTAIKKDAISPDPYWFVTHRRGVRRPRVGTDPQEARAVSKETVKGTLPERIVYKYLVSRMRMSPNSDFDFQGSLEGGRAELGGIVADIIFPYHMIIIQVQGPTHSEFFRAKKDEEQFAILEDMGYRVFELWIDVIASEYLLDIEMKRIFGIEVHGSAGSGLESGSAADASVNTLFRDIHIGIDRAFDTIELIGRVP